jgi:TolB protein
MQRQGSSIRLVPLLLTACGSSHLPSSVGPWPSAAPVNFITSGSQDFWPCFSPDGAQILLSRRIGGSWELLLVSTAGGTPHKLVTSPLPVGATRANWSKQGLIAFTGISPGGMGTVWIVNPDGSNPHELRLSGLSNQLFYPSWFPDGKAIAVMDAKDSTIKRIDLDVHTVSTISDPKSVFTGMPNVDPSGARIVFAGQSNAGQRYDQSKNSIWVIDGTGSAHLLESTPAQGRAPSRSPTGKQIAFESNRGNGGGLLRNICHQS